VDYGRVMHGSFRIYKKKLQMSTFMKARGMPFKPREAIDGMHPWARPGDSRAKDPLRGAI